jgi:hypothetical protein
MMRHPVTIASILLLVFSAISASAADKSVWDKCNQTCDTGASISACTQIVQASGETASDRAIAYSIRGGAYQAEGDSDRAIEDFTNGGKLRCTGATWTDAVVIFPGEVLAFQNIERQAHALRAPARAHRRRQARMRSGHPLERIDGGKLRCHRRDVVRRRGDFSGRSFGLPKYRAPSACAPGTR